VVHDDDTSEPAQQPIRSSQRSSSGGSVSARHRRLIDSLARDHQDWTPEDIRDEINASGESVSLDAVYAVLRSSRPR
jgi:Fe2+ or Zn2+ uptake regulation protein